MIRGDGRPVGSDATAAAALARNRASVTLTGY